MLMGNTHVYIIGCNKVMVPVMVPLPECKHIAKFLQDKSDRGLISCIGKFLKTLG